MKRCEREGSIDFISTLAVEQEFDSSPQEEKDAFESALLVEMENFSKKKIKTFAARKLGKCAGQCVKELL